MKKICLLFVLAFTSSLIAVAQTIYPSNWFVGMKDNKLQLMIHAANNIGVDKLVFKSSSPDVKVIKVTRPDNRHYIFVDLEIAKTARPQKVKFSFGGIIASEWSSFEYELKARSKDNGRSRAQGVTAKDFVYLMLPDRFANGDPSNDVVPGYRAQTADRNNKYDRHGGDFKGIEQHFDYFKQLGVTTIWMTPVIENNVSMMHEFGNNVAGYHGYWFTDHYQIDKRFGGNDGYLDFCNKAHANGLKVIQDAVYNHVSKEHWFVLDPPFTDWINNWPAFQGPNHREEVLFDPYASAHDKKIMLDGWFVDHLPDLNQRNPFLATYLVQHALWTTETFGVDAWRVDTYKYCDEAFLNRVNTALYREFPGITVFGEAWVNSVIGNAYFTNNNIATPFKHNANGVIDFQTCFAMLSGLNQAQGWMNGVNKIYTTLAQDVAYTNPMNNCIFLDNHDMDRIYSVAGEDWGKLKMGINWLLTLRGIPQLYYGTEVLMKNFKNPNDAAVREDFPGGWSGDTGSKFNKAGRSAKEDSVFQYISKLAGFRKTSSAITSGKLMQFIPKDGAYLYFRYDAKQTVLVIANTGTKAVKPDWSVYKERASAFTKARNVTTGETINLSQLEVKPGESFVFELVR